MLALVFPYLTHEGAVEVWLATEQWVDSRIAQKLGENDDLGRPVKDCTQDSGARQGQRHAFLLDRDGGFVA